MDTEAFIVEICNRPPIWMSKHPHHKIKPVVKKMWDEMKQCFPEYEVEQLRKKWKNLKDAYRKELKKVTRSVDLGFEDDGLAQWKYFSNLAFLKDEFLPGENKSNVKRKTQAKESEHETQDLSNVKSEKNTEFEIETEDLSNLKTEHQNTESDQEAEDLANLKSEYQNTESHKTEDLKNITSPWEDQRTMPSRSSSGSPRPANASPQPYRSRSNTPTIPRKRLTPNAIRAEYLEIEKKKLKILEQEVARQNSIRTQNSPEKTEDYYYLMSILPEMQKLTSIQKMRVRNKINQILLDEMIVNNNK